MVGDGDPRMRDGRFEEFRCVVVVDRCEGVCEDDV